MPPLDCPAPDTRTMPLFKALEADLDTSDQLPLRFDDLQSRFCNGQATPSETCTLLAQILRATHGPNTAYALARTLLERFGTAQAAIAANATDLISIEGLGDAGIAIIKTVETLAIMHARSTVPADIHPLLNNYDAIIDYCRARLGHKAREEFHLLFLNTHNFLIRAERQQSGTVNSAPAYPREILRRALELHAAAIVIVHNHPSGIPTPSRRDVDLTNKIATACKVLDIRLHDHIVITRSDHFSFTAKGLL